MALSKRERLRRATRREPLDRLPTQINTTPAMRGLLSEYLGVPSADLDVRLGNHLLRVDLSHPRRLSPDGSTAFDWWGAGWSTETEGYWHTHAPLGDTEDLDAMEWPDPDSPDLLTGATEAMVRNEDERFVVPNLGFALFERAWSLRGYEQLNTDLALRPEWVEDLLDRIAAVQVRLIERYVALGVDGGYFGDDYGAQRGLLFSPRTWRRLFRPRLERMFAPFREAGLPIIMHSDGDIQSILPDLVEIGLNCLNPAQPEVLDFAWLRRTFPHLSYYGGISTQHVLPDGTPAEVSTAVDRSIAQLADDGSGLLVGPSHRMQSDIPLANIDAMLAAMARIEEKPS